MKNKPAIASSKTPAVKTAVPPAKPTQPANLNPNPPVNPSPAPKPPTPAPVSPPTPTPPPASPPTPTQPTVSLGAIQNMMNNSERNLISALNSGISRIPQPTTPRPEAPWKFQVMLVIICLTLVIVSIIAFKDNGTKAAMSAKAAAESSEMVSSELIKKVSTTLATKADIKSEIESDGKLTRKDINSATAALVDKATLSVGEINKHSSGLAKSIQEKVDSTGSKLEQMKKSLDEQQLPPTTKEIREALGEMLLNFRKMETATAAVPVSAVGPAVASASGSNTLVAATASPAAPAAPAAVVSQQPTPAPAPTVMATTKGIVNERVYRETLAPNTISRRYYAQDIEHGKVKITKRTETVVVNNHIPGTWHRDNQTSPLSILPTQVVTTYTGVDWVTFTSSGPMEIELLK